MYREIHMFLWHYNLFVDKAESLGFEEFEIF